jgi:hypothetical protein
MQSMQRTATASSMARRALISNTGSLRLCYRPYHRYIAVVSFIAKELNPYKARVTVSAALFVIVPSL